MAEPALASIIQEDIGANPGHPPRHDRHGTFSFDVMNGGCGVLTAAHLVDAFVGSGSARARHDRRGRRRSRRRARRAAFHSRPSAARFSSSTPNGDEGFRAFDFRTFPEHADLFVVRLRFDEPSRDRNILDVRETTPSRAAASSAGDRGDHAFLERCGVAARDVDLLVASQYPTSFAGELARAMGIAPDRVPLVAPSSRARAHRRSHRRARSGDRVRSARARAPRALRHGGRGNHDRSRALWNGLRLKRRRGELADPMMLDHVRLARVGLPRVFWFCCIDARIRGCCID